MIVLAPVSNIAAGQNIRLDASGSSASCERSLSRFEWRMIDAGGGGSLVSGATSAEATVLVPSSGALTLELTVTDSAAAVERRRIEVTPSAISTDVARSASGSACPVAINAGPAPAPPAPTPTPTPTNPSSSGSGGGGSFNILMLLMLAWVATMREAAYRKAHRAKRQAASGSYQ